MAVAVSYPGVYIEEVPSGVQTIVGVATSVAAFVGYTVRGPVNDPVQIFSFADFEREFGGLHADSELSYAVRDFTLNGGATAWIARVAKGAAAASVDLKTAPNGVPTLTATAKTEGQWGNALVISVDYATANPASTFNLSVAEMVDRNGRLVEARNETHRNLSMNELSGNYAVGAVNASSDLIELADQGASVTDPGESRSATLTEAVAGELNDDRRQLAISIDGGPYKEFDLFGGGGSLPTPTLEAIAEAIQEQVQALEPGNGAFTNFTCTIDASQILARSGTTGSRSSSVVFAPAPIRSATAMLRLGTAGGGRETEAAASIRPAATGTAGGRISNFSAVTWGVSDQMTVELRDAKNVAFETETVTLRAPTSLAEARAQITKELQTSNVAAFGQAQINIIDEALVITPGGTRFSQRFEFAGDAADKLLLSNGQGGVPSVAAYQPGIGPSTQAQVKGSAGNDGTRPGLDEIRGTRSTRTGLFALEDVDLFNILNLPGVSEYVADPEAVNVLLATAISYAEERRAMILLDMPADRDTFDKARDWINDPAVTTNLRHPNAVAYFSRILAADPLQNNRLRSFANSGTIAGIYARTDAAQGVWQAPAGTEARLRGVQGLEYGLTDPENGVLNQLGLNSLRVFDVFGFLVWGARTMVGADALTHESKYLNVRRLTLFIEESLYRGTQFAVFRPNGETLWSELRLSVGTFMNNLFRQGAFQGTTPQQAYLVRCDATTTTQADIDLGIVNIIVGFAPLKPAEFVIIQIQQLAGQSQT